MDTTTPKLRQWTVPMTLTHGVHVTVEAESAEEAKEKAETMEWVDDGMSGGELVNWEVNGKAREA